MTSESEKIELLVKRIKYSPSRELVYVFWLMIYPITLGDGKRLFAHGTIPAAFKVTESIVSSKGVMVVNYERTGSITNR